MAPEGEPVMEREPVVEREAVIEREAVVKGEPACVRCERTSAKMSRPAGGEMAAHAPTKMATHATPTKMGAHATPHLSRCVSGDKRRSA